MRWYGHMPNRYQETLDKLTISKKNGCLGGNLRKTRIYQSRRKIIQSRKMHQEEMEYLGVRHERRGLLQAGENL